jgi:hypothetical protein
MNDPVFFEAAQSLAARIERESQGPFRNRLNYAYELALGRPPSEREAARLGRFFDERQSWVEVSRVLLNLDEFITRE